MAISVVNRNKNFDNASGTITSTFPSNTIHNAIIIAVIADGVTTDISTPTDTPGNTYTLLTGTNVGDGVSQVMKWFANFDIKTSAGTNTVSCSDNFDDAIMFIWEVAGLASTSAAFDKFQSNAQSSATSLTSGATASTSFANELVLGITGNVNGSSLLPTVGAGFSNLQTTGTSFEWGGSEELIVSSTGAQTATFGLATNTTTEFTAVATFTDGSGPKSRNLGFVTVNTRPYPFAPGSAL